MNVSPRDRRQAPLAPFRQDIVPQEALDLPRGAGARLQLAVSRNKSLRDSLDQVERRGLLGGLRLQGDAGGIPFG